jgi:FAD synthase
VDREADPGQRGVRRRLRALLRAHAGPAVVSVGTFDGVHAGHRALLARAAGEARARGVRLVALTFAPRPDVVVARGPSLPDICSLDERVVRLRAAGADDVVVVPFTRELMGLEARTFAGHLVDDLGLVALCVGTEFALGRGRQGTVDALRALGLEVIAVPVLRVAGQPGKLSSSGIRGAIRAGVPPGLARTGAAPLTGDVVPLDELRCLRGAAADPGTRFTLTGA